MERIIQIDSSFVNKNIYPYDTDFLIPINGTPPSNADSSDTRCVFYTQEQVLDRFLWIGNDTIHVFNSLSNNAVSFDFYALDGSTLVADFSSTMPPPNVPIPSFELYLRSVIEKSNYFVGCFFYFEGFMTQITQYNGTTKKLTLLTPFPFRSTTGSGLGYIVNPTQTSPNHLVVLLESSFALTQTLQDLLGVKTINRSQTIWQVRTGQQFLVQDFTPLSRDVVLEPSIYDYHANDLFLLRPTPSTLTGIVDGSGQKFWYQGVYTFQIVNGGTGYTIGSRLKITGSNGDAIFTVEGVGAGGHITSLSVTSPGDGFDTSLYNLSPIPPNTGTGGSLHITKTSPYFKASNNIDDQRKLLAFFPDFQVHLPLQYFVVFRVINSIVYFYTDRSTLDAMNEPSSYYNIDDPQGGATLVEFIPYHNFYPSINVPMVPFQQSVCYRVKIASITLPNLPVCGYNILLANFPYVLVTLMNATSGGIGSTSGGENFGVLLSNNPNAVRSTFVCPIANIRNPDYVRFVVVSSSQSITMKFTANDAMRFTVNLPNGELLKFQNNQGICERSTPITKTFAEGDNVNAVYTFRYRRSLVSVTFSFQLLT